MEQPQNQPIYTDRHRIPVNITLIFTAAVAVFGLFRGSWELVAFALAIGVYSWLTNARHYRIYPGALVIVFGTPRSRVIPFSNVSHLEMRQIQIPDRLRVWLVNGRRVNLVVRDPEAFQDQMQKALDEFRRQNPEYAIADRSGSDSPPSQEPSERPPDLT